MRRPDARGADRPGPAQYDDVARVRGAMRNAEDLYRRTPQRHTLAGSWRVFTQRYGWRAYALPILLIVTIGALLTTHAGSGKVAGTPPRAAGNRHVTAKPPTAPPTAAASQTLKNDAGGTVDPKVLAAAALPAGPAYSLKGDGTFTVLKGTSPAVGKGRLYRYSIEVEKGIRGIDLRQFQQDVVATLSNPQSWSGHGVSLERVDSGPIDFRVSLTSSMTVRKLCGYQIRVETSCYDPAGSSSKVNRVVFNDSRWVRGSAAYVGDLAAYRVYMINHEDGHALGHQHAHQCLPGGLAPVMMQQTFGLRSASTDKFCQSNAWPYPKGVAGAPGAEQRDTPQNDEYGIGD